MTLFLVVSGYCFLESTTAVKPFKISCSFSSVLIPACLNMTDLKVIWDGRGRNLVTVGIQHQGEALQPPRLWFRIKPGRNYCFKKRHKTALQSSAVTVTPSEIRISQEPWQVSQNGFGSPKRDILATSCQQMES